MPAKEALILKFAGARHQADGRRATLLRPDGYWHVRGVALPLPGRWHQIDALVTDFQRSRCRMSCRCGDGGSRCIRRCEGMRTTRPKTVGNPRFGRFSQAPALYFRSRSGFTAPLLVSH
jgi:hypothetical protein